MIKATPWPTRTPPAVEPDTLLAFAFALLGGEPGLSYRSLAWWHDTTQQVHAVYTAHPDGHTCTMPTNTMLRVARHLKFYYDQRARENV